MKTKLLRKIRKEYSIYRVDRESDSASDWDKCITESFNLPYYEVYGNHEVVYKQHFEQARMYILKEVRRRYSHKVKGNTEIKTKVWWNGKVH